MNVALRHNLSFSIFFAILYIALFKLTVLIGVQGYFGGSASPIFLPAFVRLLAFLVLDYWAIPSLFVAGLFCVDLGLGMEGRAVVSAFLAIGGPLGTSIASHAIGVRPNLANLTPVKLLSLSLACALGNAIFYNIGLAIAGIEMHFAARFFVIFAGDVLGTWVMIYAIKLAMARISRFR